RTSLGSHASGPHPRPEPPPPPPPSRLPDSPTATVDQIREGGAVDNVSRFAAVLGRAVDRLDRGGTLDDLGAAVKSARRIADQVEHGRGWLHVLVYDEPEALRRLKAILVSTQALLDKADSGQSPGSLLLSPANRTAARSLLAAMDALGRAADKPGAGDGLLPALLFDPEYKPIAGDLQVVARNFRVVSEKVANGEWLLGALLQGGGDGGLEPAAADFRV